MPKQKAEDKARQAMELIDRLFAPEIIFENSSLQSEVLREPCVIICNHTRRSLQNCICKMDGALVRRAFNNKNICSLMAKDIMEMPVIRGMLEGLDCIPISRDAAATDWLRECVKRLRGGCSVVIFPEGTTVKDEDITDFKPGFALLAAMAGVKVLPLAVNGIYVPFTKGRLKLTIGVPRSLQSPGRSAAALEAEALRFRKIVEDMYRSMREDGSETGESLVNT